MRNVFQSSLQIVEHDAAAIAPRRHVIVDMDRLPRIDLPDDMLSAIMTVPDEQNSVTARWKGIEMLDASSVSEPIDVSDPATDLPMSSSREKTEEAAVVLVTGPIRKGFVNGQKTQSPNRPQIVVDDQPVYASRVHLASRSGKGQGHDEGLELGDRSMI